MAYCGGAVPWTNHDQSGNGYPSSEPNLLVPVRVFVHMYTWRRWRRSFSKLYDDPYRGWLHLHAIEQTKAQR